MPVKVLFLSRFEPGVDVIPRVYPRVRSIFPGYACPLQAFLGEDTHRCTDETEEHHLEFACVNRQPKPVSWRDGRFRLSNAMELRSSTPVKTLPTCMGDHD